MLVVLTLVWTLVTVAIGCIGFFYFPDLTLRWITILAGCLGIAAFSLVINRLGHTRLASWTFSVMLWLLVTVPCYSAGGFWPRGSCRR